MMTTRSGTIEPTIIAIGDDAGRRQSLPQRCDVIPNKKKSENTTMSSWLAASKHPTRSSSNRYHQATVRAAAVSGSIAPLPPFPPLPSVYDSPSTTARRVVGTTTSLCNSPRQSFFSLRNKKKGIINKKEDSAIKSPSSSATRRNPPPWRHAITNNNVDSPLTSARKSLESSLYNSPHQSVPLRKRVVQQKKSPVIQQPQQQQQQQLSPIYVTRRKNLKHRRRVSSISNSPSPNSSKSLGDALSSFPSPRSSLPPPPMTSDLFSSATTSSEGKKSPRSSMISAGKALSSSSSSNSLSIIRSNENEKNEGTHLISNNVNVVIPDNEEEEEDDADDSENQDPSSSSSSLEYEPNEEDVQSDCSPTVHHRNGYTESNLRDDAVRRHIVSFEYEEEEEEHHNDDDGFSNSTTSTALSDDDDDDDGDESSSSSSGFVVDSNPKGCTRITAKASPILKRGSSINTANVKQQQKTKTKKVHFYPRVQWKGVTPVDDLTETGDPSLIWYQKDEFAAIQSKILKIVAKVRTEGCNRPKLSTSNDGTGQTKSRITCIRGLERTIHHDRYEQVRMDALDIVLDLQFSTSSGTSATDPEVIAERYNSATTEARMRALYMAEQDAEDAATYYNHNKLLSF